ncbi:hypothetical protein GKZ28_11080 [Clostridium chromiireducens]|uniref:Uncharacterized protein n=1 Tax=Clostridium chromiireducens TaxID=225345 RepID=A0A964RMC1_9CLOT|nr:hypothetical protein [Clostridium chromiireducens]MVX64233.1 hypothetical protein [Clostridium chromiireducens]
MFNRKSKYEQDKDLIEYNNRLIEREESHLVEINEYKQRVRTLEDKLEEERKAKLEDDKLTNKSLNETVTWKNKFYVTKDALDDTQRSAGHIVGTVTQTNKKTELKPEL